MVVKTNIDITFANNRCSDLSLAEFIIYFQAYCNCWTGLDWTGLRLRLDLDWT